MLTALHAHSNKMDEFDEWSQSLSSNIRSNMQNSGMNDAAWRMGARLIPPTDDNLDRRAVYAVNVVRFDLQQRSSPPNRPPTAVLQNGRHLVEFAVNNGLFTAEEIKSKGASLFRASGDAPAQESAAREFFQGGVGQWLLSQRAHAPAAEAFRSLIKLGSGDADVSEIQVAYLLALAECEKELKQYAEARETLARLEGKQLPAAMRTNFTRLKQQIDQLERVNRRSPDATEPGKQNEAQPPGTGASPKADTPQEPATLTQPPSEHGAWFWKTGRSRIAAHGVSSSSFSRPGWSVKPKSIGITG
jgi:hypothetical protein